MLVLFHDKKYYNCINLFPCILWDLIVIDLVLSDEDLLKIVDLATSSGLNTHKGPCEEHMWKFKS